MEKYAKFSTTRALKTRFFFFCLQRNGKTPFFDRESKQGKNLTIGTLGINLIHLNKQEW